LRLRFCSWFFYGTCDKKKANSNRRRKKGCGGKSVETTEARHFPRHFLKKNHKSNRRKQIDATQTHPKNRPAAIGSQCR
jgi:hypothetical protein